MATEIENKKVETQEVPASATPVILNGQITETALGYDKNGVLTSYFSIKGDGWDGGFGLFPLEGAKGLAAIEELLKTLDVGRWENLKGQFIRVVVFNNKLVKIGNLIQDKWFSFEEFFKLWEMKQNDENKEETISEEKSTNEKTE